MLEIGLISLGWVYEVTSKSKFIASPKSSGSRPTLDNFSFRPRSNNNISVTASLPFLRSTKFDVPS